MKKLKQTLGKEEPKKSKNLNLSTTIPSIKRIKNQTNPTYLYKSPGKSTAEQILESHLINIIQNTIKSNTATNIDKIVKQILEKCQENQKINNIFKQKQKSRLNKTANYTSNQELYKLEQISDTIEGILEKSQGNGNEKILRQFYDQLSRVIRNRNKISKKERLDEYEQLIKFLSPKRGNIKAEVSPKNFKVKVTKQQYQIKRQSSPDSSIRMGSQGKRVKTSGSNNSGFKSQNGHQKLKKFLQKDSSLKIIKTKVQYDYSAIFEASKSKIQTRNKNMTTIGNTKSNVNINDGNITSKLNKAKKNEAFVFYRPKAGMKKE